MKATAIHSRKTSWALLALAVLVAIFAAACARGAAGARGSGGGSGADAKTAEALLRTGDAFNAHDMDTYLSMYADDFQWDIANAPAKIGRGDFANGIKSIPASDPTVRHLQNRILVSGSMGFFEGCSFIYTNPATKRQYRTFHCDIVELNAKGQLTLMSSFSDGAAEAVALGKIAPPLPAPPLPGTRIWPTASPKPTKLAPAAAQKDAEIRFNSHDLDAIASGLADEASVLLSVMYDPQNREAYVGWLSLMFAAFPDLKVEPTRGVDFGNGIVVDEVRLTGTNTGTYMGHKATGKPISLRGVWFGEYGKDGLAKRLELHFDSALIWTQLGLPALSL